MINDAMFRRNGKAGYVLKPQALREVAKESLIRPTSHRLKVRVISAQQLPRPRNSQGREILDKVVFGGGVMDPYVEVSLLVPDWTQSAKLGSEKTKVVKNNGFNPVWDELFSMTFDCFGDMKDLVFLKFAVKVEGQDSDEPLAQYVTPLGCLRQGVLIFRYRETDHLTIIRLSGYRHIPLHDSQLSQFLFSTLFIHTELVET